MTKPVHIFIDGSELVGWTEMSLHRSKNELTGSLDISIFMGRIPEAPCLCDAAHGREITVYIGGIIAFVGTIDRRIGTAAKHTEPGTDHNYREGTADAAGDTSRNASIGPDEYTVQLSCRGGR